MLSDEEREAIEKIKRFNQYNWEMNNLKGKEFAKPYFESLDTLLNLIEKQSKEIEHQKEKRENQKKELAILNAKQIEFNKLVNTVNSYKGQFKRQQKEIEELKETLKCTQNSWFEDTQKIEEMKKQIDLDNECEIALNNKIMDLEKEIEELKENNKTLKNLQNDTNRLYIEMIERKNYFERELQKVVDKIKAKIEEYRHKDFIKMQVVWKHDKEALKIVEVLQSLLEKE